MQCRLRLELPDHVQRDDVGDVLEVPALPAQTADVDGKGGEAEDHHHRDGDEEDDGAALVPGPLAHRSGDHGATVVTEPSLIRAIEVDARVSGSAALMNGRGAMRGLAL